MKKKADTSKTGEERNVLTGLERVTVSEEKNRVAAKAAIFEEGKGMGETDKRGKDSGRRLT